MIAVWEKKKRKMTDEGVDNGGKVAEEREHLSHKTRRYGNCLIGKREGRADVMM